MRYARRHQDCRDSQHRNQWGATQVFTPRTPLCKKLWELRKKHLASGEPLLTLDEVRREVQDRRGGIADEEDGA